MPNTANLNVVDAKYTYIRSFRNLSFEGFPSGYSKSVCACASACTQKTPYLRCGFLKRRLTNTSRRHHLADGQLSSP